MNNSNISSETKKMQSQQIDAENGETSSVSLSPQPQPKKLLFLGGILQQVPAIKRARELGYYVITCDYLPSNPGHAFADEYHNVSTTDLEAVLALARELKIDGIVAYASDPAAPTAAYVAEKLGLPGNPYESVKLLTEKDLFRDFLEKHGFNCPWHIGIDFSHGERVEHGEENGCENCRKGAWGPGQSPCDNKNSSCSSCSPWLNNVPRGLTIPSYPCMVKPVDSSGSKGVVKVSSPDELPTAIEEALSYSRAHRIVIEEFIVKQGYQVSGDGFSVDGKLVFTSYGNELYSNKGTREYVALGEFWPSLLTPVQREKVDAELQRLITALGMRTCAYNIEVILDKDDNVYILELGPRNGGSYIPQLIQYATGVDMVTATLRAAMGDSFSLEKVVGKSCSCRKDGLIHSTTTTTHYNFVSNYMLYSTRSGIFSRLAFDSAFERDNLLEVHCTAKPGDTIHAYQNTSHSLGTILFKASSLAEIQSITANIEKYYQVVVDESPTAVKMV